MKAPKLDVFDLHLGTFDFSVRVCVGPQAAASKMASELHGLDYDDTERRGAAYVGKQAGEFMPVLWMPRPPETPREHATLAHEALHIAITVAEWANIRLCDESEEVYCHLVACIVNGALEAWGKKHG